MTVYYCSDNPNKNPKFTLVGRKFSIDQPCVCVMAKGMYGDSLGHWHFLDDGKTDHMMIPKQQSAPPRGRRQLFDAGKPEYRVPLVSEVAAAKDNGLTVATTFAGCGGSSFGYRLAGYRVVWANEFVPIAQESYAANMMPYTVLDGRDIKQITPAEILKATGLGVGELDVFDGSPPCQAFSTAGKREKGWGTERKYSHGAKQKNEDLFFEYVRIRDGLQPRAFIAENVSGLVKGAAKGYFLEILRQLKRGYRVEVRLLDAQWLGVPQSRQRIIFVGVREDLGIEPAFPTPLPYRYSVRDAIPWIAGGSMGSGHSFAQRKLDPDDPAHTVMANSHGGAFRDHEVEARVVYANGRKGQPARDITDSPSPTITAGPTTLAEGGGPRSHFRVEQIVFRGGPGGKKRGQVKASIDDPAHTVTATGYGASAANQTRLVGAENHAPGVLLQGPQVDFRNSGKELNADLPAPTVVAGNASRRDPKQFEVRVVPGDRGGRRRRESGKAFNLNEPMDTVVADGGRPNGAQFMVEGEAAATDIQAQVLDRLQPGESFDERGRSLGYKGGFGKIKTDARKPSATICTSPDIFHPTEKRKFTIAELRRICAFPDDFKLVGTYGQQWERLGNSVPPVMMQKIAEIVRDKILLPARAAGRSKATRRARGRGRAASR